MPKHKHFVVSALLAVLLLAGCNKANPSNAAGNPSNGVRISVAAAQRRSFGTELQKIAEMRPAVERVARYNIESTVTSVEGKVGQEVKEGDVLFTLDDTDLRLLVQQQSDYLEIARINLENARASGNNLAAAEIQHRIATRNHQMALKNLDRAAVKAPIDGTLVMCDAKVGEPANTAQAVVAVLDKAALTIYVESSVIGSLNPKDAVEATSSSAPGVTLKGQVIDANPHYFVQGKGYPVNIELDMGGSELLPYGTVDVMVLGSFDEQVLVIPIKAIVEQDDGRIVVFVVNSNNTVSMREVQTGYSDEDNIVVVHGLLEGELVATSGTRLLEDGAKVIVE